MLTRRYRSQRTLLHRVGNPILWTGKKLIKLRSCLNQGNKQAWLMSSNRRAQRILFFRSPVENEASRRRRHGHGGTSRGIGRSSFRGLHPSRTADRGQRRKAARTGAGGTAVAGGRRDAASGVQWVWGERERPRRLAGLFQWAEKVLKLLMGQIPYCLCLSPQGFLQGFFDGGERKPTELAQFQVWWR